VYSRGILRINHAFLAASKSFTPRRPAHFIKTLKGFYMENYFGCAIIRRRHNNHRDANDLFNSVMIGVFKNVLFATVLSQHCLKGKNSMEINRQMRCACFSECNT